MVVFSFISLLSMSNDICVFLIGLFFSSVNLPVIVVSLLMLVFVAVTVIVVFIFSILNVVLLVEPIHVSFPS